MENKPTRKKTIIALAILCIVIAISVSLFLLFRPRYVFMEMSAISDDGEQKNVILDLVVRRNLLLEPRIHGIVYLGDVQYISVWDLGVWTGVRNPYREIAISSNHWFVPSHLGIGTEVRMSMALGVQMWLDFDSLNFNAVVVTAFPPYIMVPGMGGRFATRYFAPAKTIEEADGISEAVFGEIFRR